MDFFVDTAGILGLEENNTLVKNSKNHLCRFFLFKKTVLVSLDESSVHGTGSDTGLTTENSSLENASAGACSERENQVK